MSNDMAKLYENIVCVIVGHCCYSLQALS